MDRREFMSVVPTGLAATVNNPTDRSKSLYYTELAVRELEGFRFWASCASWNNVLGRYLAEDGQGRTNQFDRFALVSQLVFDEGLR